MLTAKDAALIAAKALDDRKGLKIRVLEVKGLTTLTEYMVIATGTSDTHIRALCDEVEKKMDAAGETLMHRDGYRGDTWIVLDYSGVMVHVFTRDQREFYGLEHIWSDAPAVDLKEVLKEQETL